MPGTSRSKRTQSSRTTDTAGLLYTTYEFIRRLRARGRPLRLDVRDALLQWLQARADDTSEANLEWATDSPDLQRHLSTLPPMEDPSLPVVRLCALLAPLQAYDLQYINLAVVLHSLSLTEIKNLYRYCYLEWMQHAPSSPLTPTLWVHTPRQFAALSALDTAGAWEAFLARAVSSSPTQETASTPLFFINRLYSYLTPCG